uniref:Uncharacterized protein n=1 Tax=uncultured bacterium 5G4 TaxID=1701326 RepID=A0A166H3S8_9BACT|nr:hypothetical protein 5G4_040 [uncultured bacterium 5G4]
MRDFFRPGFPTKRPFSISMFKESPTFSPNASHTSAGRVIWRFSLRTIRMVLSYV